MKHKPETWARAEQLIFVGARADTFESKLNQEPKETFSANDPQGRAGCRRSMDQEGTYPLLRTLRTI